MPRTISPLCVYCGTAWGARPVYAQAARELGVLMARRGIEMIYGGGKLGLMGEVADGVLGAGGRVTGVITAHLKDREVAHNGLTRLEVVDTMHERKKRMADAARAFVALPGGVGTMDEMFEMLAWSQLAIHDHPVGLLNVDGYYDHLLAWMGAAAAEGFLRVDLEQALVVSPEPGGLLDGMAAWEGVCRRTWDRRNNVAM